MAPGDNVTLLGVLISRPEWPNSDSTFRLAPVYRADPSD